MGLHWEKFRSLRKTAQSLICVWNSGWNLTSRLPQVPCVHVLPFSSLVKLAKDWSCQRTSCILLIILYFKKFFFTSFFLLFLNLFLFLLFLIWKLSLIPSMPLNFEPGGNNLDFTATVHISHHSFPRGFQFHHHSGSLTPSTTGTLPQMFVRLLSLIFSQLPDLLWAAKCLLLVF